MTTDFVQFLDMPDTLKTAVGLMVGAGSVFYVDSGNSSAADNASSGTATATPFATLGFAAGQVAANNGDIIIVLPGHSETITAADGIRFAIADVNVIGLGNGTNRPTINFTTAVTADLEIDAANISLHNIYFDMTGVDAVTAGIDVNESHFTMTNCEILMADGTGQAVIGIDLDTNANNTRISNTKIFAPNAGATEAIGISGAFANLEIAHCWIAGAFTTACIDGNSNIITEVYIHHCMLQNDSTGVPGIDFNGACTGALVYNMYHNDMTQATGVDPGSCFSFECYQCDVVDRSGILTPQVT